jgi:hypothetical protein
VISTTYGSLIVRIRLLGGLLVAHRLGGRLEHLWRIGAITEPGDEAAEHTHRERQCKVMCMREAPFPHLPRT